METNDFFIFEVTYKPSLYMLLRVSSRQRKKTIKDSFLLYIICMMKLNSVLFIYFFNFLNMLCIKVLHTSWQFIKGMQL